jgi:hypothetical protein
MAQGAIVYSEVVHEGVCKLEAYVEKMATGGLWLGSGRRAQILGHHKITTRDQSRAEESHQSSL